MTHQFRSRLIQRIRLRYLAALMAFVVVALAMMALTPATTQASTFALAGSHDTLTGSIASGAVMPQSSRGCNQQVCIAVCNNAKCKGHGLFIDHVIETGVSTSRHGCVVGQLLVRGSVRLQTKQFCWLNPPHTKEFLRATYILRYRVANGSQICVRFKGLGAPKGMPCEIAHP